MPAAKADVRACDVVDDLIMSFKLLPTILGTALFAVGVLTGSFCLRGPASDCGDASAPSALRAAIDKKSAPEPEAEPNTCTICGETGTFTTFNKRAHASCPTCSSKERHRLLIHYIQNETTILKDKLDVLQFSPQDGEAAFFRKHKNLNYKASEYDPGIGDIQLDITKINQPDNSWDLIICYHILEHIVEDHKAMAELFRILRPGGQVILQVPIETGRTELYEDASIVDDKGRAKAFGQRDHVRRYSAQGLKERLEKAGFVVEAVDYLAKLDKDVIAKYGLSGKFKPPLEEHIWVARKPAPAPAP